MNNITEYMLDAQYMIKEDRKVIENWANEKNVSVSFRPAGNASIRALIYGAGAKPHDILDKTIKWKNGDDENNNAILRLCNVEPYTIDFAYIEGLVGKWKLINDKKELIGLYLTTIGEIVFRNLCPEAVIEKDNEQEIPFTYLDLENNSARLKLRQLYWDMIQYGHQGEQYFYYVNFFSGDYDMHDFISHDNKRQELSNDKGKVYVHPALAELKSLLYNTRCEELSQMYEPIFSFDKFDYSKECCPFDIPEFIRDGLLYYYRLNIDVYGTKFEVLERRRHFIDEDISDEDIIHRDYVRVQHGEQATYMYQMIYDNLKYLMDESKFYTDTDILKNMNAIDRNVAKIGCPIAAFFRKNDSESRDWEIIKNESEYLYTFFQYIPETWIKNEKTKKIDYSSIEEYQELIRDIIANFIVTLYMRKSELVKTLDSVTTSKLLKEYCPKVWEMIEKSEKLKWEDFDYFYANKELWEKIK